MTRVYLALGSNLGDRQQYLHRAIARLRGVQGVTVLRVSACYETTPVGGPPGSGAYLNAVAEAETSLEPEVLLRAILEIEESLGRVRTVLNAPRTIDLDLILYGDLVRQGPDPVVPHPRMHERRFVLQPLADLTPDVVHPVIKKTVQALLDGLGPDPDPPRLYPRGIAEPRLELAGMNALVTGSTSGIGMAIAIELARGGANVTVHGRRSRGAAEGVATEARVFGGRASVAMADLADAAACDRLVDEVWDTWGRLDILVQNAGADVVTGEAANWPFERKWEALAAVDVTATIRLCRAIGGRMKAGRGGVILTMGWDQADTGFGEESGLLFAPAKGAVMCFTRSLARYLAPNVRVNCLAPGWIKTAWGETASEQWQQRVMTETPLERWGLPEDVAATARWLASPAAAFITGQIVRINGGVV